MSSTIVAFVNFSWELRTVDLERLPFDCSTTSCNSSFTRLGMTERLVSFEIIERRYYYYYYILRPWTQESLPPGSFSWTRVLCFILFPKA